MQRTSFISHVLAMMVAATCGMGLARVAHGQCEQGWIAGAGLPAPAGAVIDVRVFVKQGVVPQEYTFARGPSEIGGVVASTASGWFVHDGTTWRLLGELPGAPAVLGSSTVTIRSTRSFVYFYSGSQVIRWDGSEFESLATLANATQFFVSESVQGDQLFLSARENTLAPWQLKRLVNGSWIDMPSAASSLDQVRCMEYLDDVPGGRIVAVRVVNNQAGLFQYEPSGWTLLHAIVEAEPIAAYRPDYQFLKQGVGESTRLILGGPIDSIGGRSVKHVAVYENGAWASLGDGLVQAPLSMAHDPLDPARGIIVVSPNLVRQGTSVVLREFLIRRLTPNGWSVMPGSIVQREQLVPPIARLASGQHVVLGGNFVTLSGDANQQGIAKWDESQWRGMGPTVQNGIVHAIEAIDLGDGTEVFVAGGFQAGARGQLKHVAKWTGQEWSNVGHGLVSTGGSVLSLTSQVTSAGPGLLAGTSAAMSPAGILSLGASGWLAEHQVSGTSYVNAFARYDSGTGIEHFGLIKSGSPEFWRKNANVWQGSAIPSANWIAPYAMRTFDDGSGAALYICGRVSGGRPCVFRKVGQSWQTIASGVTTRLNGGDSNGMCLATWEVDGAERLLMGGSWYMDLVSPARYASMFWWNGSSWTEFEPKPPGIVADLTTHDFGAGPTLVSLLLQPANGDVPTRYESATRMRPYRLVNGAWEPFGTVQLTGGTNSVYEHGTAIGVIRSIDGELWMGGPFRAVDGMPSYLVARYGCLCSADFNRDSTLDLFDYLDFVAAFAEQAPTADFNRDGVIDFFDYLDFVARFAAGC